MSALELRDAAVRLGGRTIWEGVDLAVEPGTFIAVLGPNGAGKSTLLKVALGLVPLTAGMVRAPAKREIGYLPQHHHGEGTAPIRGVDLVRLGLDGARWGVPLPRRGDARRARVAEAIRDVGAEHYAEQPFGSLSGGERQRLLIAQALVRRPRLLLLDEPLEGLDLPNQHTVAALVQRICREQGVAVLLVAHDVNPISDYLDQVVYVAGGTAVAGTPAEVITDETLSRLYGTPIEVLRTREGRLVVVGQPDTGAHVH
ncbi:MAG TPA: metal ABC transporter ATP-binding protein [Solirubrobacteraceae bacterium]|nr:metal ABC transporter ATP-binding protein [Solirubrobacteraceae bacterium]